MIQITKKARRSDSLFHDNISRRGLCDMIANLESKMACREVSVQLDKDAYMPERAHSTDAGADIRTPFACTVGSNASVIIRTGVHVQLPPNTVGLLKSKSGLNIWHGIVTEGVIDEGYSGEIVVKVYNHSNTPYRFERGDKITQLLIMPVHYPTFNQVSLIQGGERGDSGHGSTGR